MFNANQKPVEPKLSLNASEFRFKKLYNPLLIDSSLPFQQLDLNQRTNVKNNSTGMKMLNKQQNFDHMNFNQSHDQDPKKFYRNSQSSFIPQDFQLMHGSQNAKEFKPGQLT